MTSPLQEDYSTARNREQDLQTEVSQTGRRYVTRYSMRRRWLLIKVRDWGTIVAKDREIPRIGERQPERDAHTRTLADRQSSDVRTASPHGLQRNTCCLIAPPFLCVAADVAQGQVFHVLSRRELDANLVVGP